MITYFTSRELSEYGIPERINDPFRYFPCPLVRYAQSVVQQDIASIKDREQLLSFLGGKMLGVLIVKDPAGKIGFIKGFSGLIAGSNHIDGFVPPVYDITDPEGFFKKGEAELNNLSDRILDLTTGEELQIEKERIQAFRDAHLAELDHLRHEHAAAKVIRNRARITGSVSEEELERESQFQKAEMKRLKEAQAKEMEAVSAKANVILQKIEHLKFIRKSRSEEIQRQLFESYIVHNQSGEAASIWSIFQAKGLVPPGGTGDCAGVKLFEFAFRNSLEPLALGEFWFGVPAAASTRLSGRFYPSCTAKCAPVLEYIRGAAPLSGLSGACPKLEILYEDSDKIAVNKPSGFPSVPGLLSAVQDVQSALSAQLGIPVYAVHRLDMDTSGVLLLAKNPATQSRLMKLFEQGKIHKTYRALVENDTTFKTIPQEGRIDLPLSADFADRPRQKAGQGKEAVTEFKVIGGVLGGSPCDLIDTAIAEMLEVEFKPLTGRTHQLRVHAANPKGLAHPILGDTLYGGLDPEDFGYQPRLYLHALSLECTDPSDQFSISTNNPFYEEII